MKNKIVGLALGASMVLGVAVPALAAATVTNLVVDGGTDTTVTEGSTVNAEITFNVSASTDVESVSWELVGSGLPKTCVNVSNSITDGTFTRSFDIDTNGASEGSWDVRIGLYGDDGADASNLCEVTDQIGGLTTFGDRITVTDNNNDNQAGNNDDTGSSSLIPSWFTAWWNANKPAATPAPTAQNAYCLALAAKKPGTVPNVYNDANIKLQGYLLSEGASIPALIAGASFGYYGPQTMAAVSWFNSVHSCY